MLIVGPEFAIRSERRICAEVILPTVVLQSRQKDKTPDDSVRSAVHGISVLIQSDALRGAFEPVVASCIAAGALSQPHRTILLAYPLSHISFAHERLVPIRV